MNCCNFPERFTCKSNLVLGMVALTAITALALGILRLTSHSFYLPGGNRFAYGMIGSGAAVLALILFAVCHVKAKMPTPDPLVDDPLVHDDDIHDIDFYSLAPQSRNFSFHDSLIEDEGLCPPPLSIETLADLKGLMGPQFTNTSDEAFQTTVTAIQLGETATGARQITALPPILSSLPNLRVLALPGQDIQEMPNDGPLPVGLKELNLCHNRRFRLTRRIVEFPELIILNCSSCALKDLPHELDQLSNLQVADFSGNRIPSLPPLSRLERLRSLNLSNNQIHDIDPLRQLPALDTLRLAGNGLTQFPELGAGEFPRLRDLDLSNNDLLEISPRIANLTSLTHLNLRNNPRLHSLPVVALSRLPQLREIDIEGTHISPDQRRAILAACAQERIRLGLVGDGRDVVDPRSKLAKTINTWKSRANRSHEPWGQNLRVDKQQASAFDLWLERLTTTSEFQQRAAPFSDVVCNIIAEVDRNPEFSNFVVGIAADDLTGCGDRAAASFGDVYNEYLMVSLSHQAPLEEAARIACAAMRRQLLNERVAQAMPRNRTSREMAEVYVFASLKSQQELGLILPITDMLHRQIGAQPWLLEALPAIHREILAIPIATLLGQSEPWQRYLSRNLQHQVAIELFNGLVSDVITIVTEDEAQIEDPSNPAECAAWARREIQNRYDQWKSKSVDNRELPLISRFMPLIEAWERNTPITGIEDLQKSNREWELENVTVNDLVDGLTEALRAFQENTPVPNRTSVQNAFENWKKDHHKAQALIQSLQPAINAWERGGSDQDFRSGAKDKINGGGAFQPNCLIPLGHELKQLLTSVLWRSEPVTADQKSEIVRLFRNLEANSQEEDFLIQGFDQLFQQAARPIKELVIRFEIWKLAQIELADMDPNSFRKARMQAISAWEGKELRPTEKDRIINCFKSLYDKLTTAADSRFITLMDEVLATWEANWQPYHFNNENDQLDTTKFTSHSLPGELQGLLSALSSIILSS